jgi:hypothetical protein
MHFDKDRYRAVSYLIPPCIGEKNIKEKEKNEKREE